MGDGDRSNLRAWESFTGDSDRLYPQSCTAPEPHTFFLSLPNHSTSTKTNLQLGPRGLRPFHGALCLCQPGALGPGGD